MRNHRVVDYAIDPRSPVSYLSASWTINQSCLLAIDTGSLKAVCRNSEVF